MTKIVLFGDPDSTQDAEDIYSAIDKEENVDLYINGGDNGYDEEFEAAKTIIDKHFPPGSDKRKKLRINLGNHDHEESEGSQAEPFFGAMFPDLFKTQPGFEAGDSSWENPKWLWSEHLNNEIYFIGMNSQDEDIGFKRNQYNWVISELNKAKELRKQNKARWILAGVHKPWVTKKSSHSAYTNHREVYGDDFFNVVNAMWYSHNHNDHVFRSWKAIKKEGNAAIEIVESLLPDGKTIDHSKQHGMTGNINGHSGHEHNEFKENMDVPEILWYNDSKFSYAVVETNGMILNTKYKDKDGNVLGEYNISDTTDYSGGTGPDPTECSDPAKCKDPQTGECRPIGINEHKSPTDGSCQKNLPGEVICPRDYHYDASLEECIPDLEPQINPVCPPNTKWNGKVCVPDGTTPPPPCLQGECKDKTTGQCRPIGPNETKDVNGMCIPKPPTGCPDGQCKDISTGLCRPIGVNEEKDPVTGNCKPKPQPGGNIDEHGIEWTEAKGPKTIVTMSRDEATDDRWSENVPGCEQGFEAVFIGKSTGTNDSSHFAMKQGGSNHSGSGAGDERWLDTGLRVDGTIQLQYEGPHPNNHDFDLPDSKLFIKKISKGLEGNWIGLRWYQKILQPNGSPSNGGVHWKMWVDEDPIDLATGKPKNNWKLVYDFIDGQDGISVIQPQDFRMSGTMDAEVRRSDTDRHDIYGDGRIIENAQEGAPGLHVRPLT